MWAWLRETRGSLAAEMAVVAGACVIVMIIMSNVCLFLIRAGQFNRISAEAARSCAYRGAPSAQEAISAAMGLSDVGRFSVSGTESGGGVCGTKTVSFQMIYQPLISDIGIGPLAIHTPTFYRTKTYAVPSIGYDSSP